MDPLCLLRHSGNEPAVPRADNLVGPGQLDDPVTVLTVIAFVVVRLMRIDIGLAFVVCG